MGLLTLVRIDQHEALLREVGLELGAFNGTKPEPIGFVVCPQRYPSCRAPS
jgi:hypothetical protein